MDETYYQSEFSVPYQYRTFFTEYVFQRDNPILAEIVSRNHRQCAKVYFIVERVVLRFHETLEDEIEQYAQAHSDCIDPNSSLLIAEGGEGCKKIEFATEICEKMLARRLSRQSCAVIIGGGAFLDAVGFAASIFHRGIRQIRIPTTALAQCDSGVGVKNAVNAFGLKNLLGNFAPPFAVINDAAFLKTLPTEAIAAAAAESLKVSMIKDAEFFHWLGEHAEAIAGHGMEPIREMVMRAAILHIHHIESNGDPFEFGSARPLDFGHWAAHKLEMLSGGQVSHGIAVGMGLRIDTKYAALKGIVPPDVFTTLDQYEEKFQLPFHKNLLELRDQRGTRRIFDGLEEFREHLGDQLHITLPDGQIGRKLEVTEIDHDVMEEAIRFLCER